MPPTRIQGPVNVIRAVQRERWLDDHRRRRPCRCLPILHNKRLATDVIRRPREDEPRRDASRYSKTVCVIVRVEAVDAPEPGLCDAL